MINRNQRNKKHQNPDKYVDGNECIFVFHGDLILIPNLQVNLFQKWFGDLYIDKAAKIFATFQFDLFIDIRQYHYLQNIDFKSFYCIYRYLVTNHY